MNLIKYIIKNILFFFGWKIVKLDRKLPVSFSHQKPDLNNLKLILNSKGILHLGAHRGKEAEVYSWFTKKVIWIEANPKIFLDLKNHIKYYYKQQAFNVLLGEKNRANADFYLSNKDSSCSSIYDLSEEVKKGKLWKEHDVKMLSKIKIDMKTLDHVVIDKKINIQNYDHWIIDLQGAELDALRGAKKSLKKCKSLNVEISKKNFYAEGSTKWKNLKKYLIGEGFKLVKEPNKIHCDVLFIKKK